MLTNRYAGTCNNPTCKVHVAAQAGFTQKINDRYVVWCKTCVPEKIQSTKPRLLTSEGHILTPYEPENINLIKSAPGARWNPNGKFWSVSLDMANRRRVLEIANKIGLQIDPSLNTIEVSNQALDAEKAGLYPFQVEGVDFLSQKKVALLGDDMGLGKTAQSLMSIPKGTPALVICRAGLKYNWLDEVYKWRSDLNPVVLKGKQNFRWPNSDEIVIVNHDMIPDEFNTPKRNRGEKMPEYWERLATFRKGISEKNPGAANVTLILDEAHDYKNHETARSRKVKEIVKISSKVIALTGSPLTNKPTDLFNIFSVLGVEKEVFGAYEKGEYVGPFEKFKILYNAHEEIVSRGVSKTIYNEPKPILPELLRRVMLRRLRKEVLAQIPDKTYTKLVVDSTDSKLNKELDQAWDKWGTAIQLGELPPFEEFSEVREKLARSRIPEMLEYIESSEEQEVPLVVFSAHLGPLDALLNRPGWAVITGVASPEKRQEIVRAFQAGKLKGVGISIQAGGVGLTLTHAWKALFVDEAWNPVDNWQAEDRLARISQKSDKVEIVQMVSNHPLDIHVHNLLAAKTKTFVASIDTRIEGKKYDSSQGETQAEFDSRMNSLKYKAEEEKKLVAKSKVQTIHEREKAKYSGREFLATPERIAAVRESFKYMLSICDGASSLDGQGFNKPDAVVAHWLLTAGLETSQEVEAGFYILTRYSRQLSKKYPILFK